MHSIKKKFEKYFKGLLLSKFDCFWRAVAAILGLNGSLFLEINNTTKRSISADTAELTAFLVLAYDQVYRLR